MKKFIWAASFLSILIFTGAGCVVSDKNMNINTNANSNLNKNIPTGVPAEDDPPIASEPEWNASISTGQWYLTSAQTGEEKPINNIVTFYEDRTAKTELVLTDKEELPVIVTSQSVATYTIFGDQITIQALNGSATYQGTILDVNHMAGTWQKNTGSSIGEDGAWTASKY